MKELYAWSKITSSLSKWGLIKDLYIVNNVCLGKKFWILHNSPMGVLTLLSTYLKCSPTFSFSSKSKPSCFWYGVCITWLLLKINSGWLGFFILREKITWACLEGSGLKLIFHWYAQLLIFSRPLFQAANNFAFRTTKKREVSSAKSLGFDGNSYDKSLM